MFFLQQENSNQHQDKRFLTYFTCDFKNFSLHFVKLPLVFLRKCVSKTVVRRMSLLPPQKKMWKKMLLGGMTVEAALVLPVFIFFVLNLFSVIEMLRLHGNIAWALNRVGGETALYGYTFDKSGEGWNTGIVGDTVFTYFYIREEMADVLGEDYLNSSPLVGGKNGIWFSKAEIMEDDLINLVVTYQMEVPFGLADAGKVRTYNCYLGRAWTGYDLTQTETQVVYVAKLGTVYHTQENCTHLKRSIRVVAKEDINVLRSSDGSKYYACEHCGKLAREMVWITEDGNRYHGTEECGGLKRTIMQMNKEVAEKEGYRLCKKCGG